jgi:hypothetical protein
MSAGSNMLGGVFARTYSDCCGWEGASRALGGEGPRKSDLLEIKPCTGMSDEAWVMKGGEMDDDDDETDETSTPT